MPLAVPVPQDVARTILCPRMTFPIAGGSGRALVQLQIGHVTREPSPPGCLGLPILHPRHSSTPHGAHKGRHCAPKERSGKQCRHLLEA